jgi:hypothetical protein
MVDDGGDDDDDDGNGDEDDAFVSRIGSSVTRRGSADQWEHG